MSDVFEQAALWRIEAAAWKAFGKFADNQKALGNLFPWTREMATAATEVALRSAIIEVAGYIDRCGDIIAEWANDEGISFDATTKLSHKCPSLFADYDDIKRK